MNDPLVLSDTEKFHEALRKILHELDIPGRLRLDQEVKFLSGPAQVRRVAIHLEGMGFEEMDAVTAYKEQTRVERNLLDKIKEIPGFFTFGANYPPFPGLWVCYRVPW